MTRIQVAGPRAPKNSFIEVRHGSGFYLGKGVTDSVYSKVHTSEAESGVGNIILRVGQNEIALTPAEAREVGEAIRTAGQIADPNSVPPPPRR